MVTRVLGARYPLITPRKRHCCRSFELSATVKFLACLDVNCRQTSLRQRLATLKRTEKKHDEPIQTTASAPASSKITFFSSSLMGHVSVALKCLAVCPSPYVYSSIHPSVRRSGCPSVRQHPSVRPSVLPFVPPSVNQSIRQFISLSFRQSVRPSVRPAGRPSARLIARRSIHRLPAPVCPSLCPSVYQSVRQSLLRSSNHPYALTSIRPSIRPYDPRPYHPSVHTHTLSIRLYSSFSKSIFPS